LLVVTQIFVRIFALLTRGGFLVCVCVCVVCVMSLGKFELERKCRERITCIVCLCVAW